MDSNCTMAVSPSVSSDLYFGVLHQQSVFACLTVFFGYNLFSTFIQCRYYVSQPSTVARWKSQYKRTIHVGDSKWWVPILSLFRSRHDRAPCYWLFCSINITVASTMIAVATELCMRDMSRMYWDIAEYGWLYYCTWSTFVPIIFHNIAEYYWHRLMHWPFFYKTLHKYHHYYKSPEPFDDLYVHPLEVSVYYCLLYSPPFLFRIHPTSFLFYMIIMGICGVTDHSGVNFTVEGLYSAVDHDTHHLKFEYNYSFPFPYMDMLHGTFRGVFLGKLYGEPIKEHAATHGFKTPGKELENEKEK